MTNKTMISLSGDTGARRLFSEDIEETNQYLEEMQSHVKELCEKKNLQYPRGGRNFKGVYPNIPIALHFRLRGYKPITAARIYVEQETGRSLQPVDPAGVAC